MIWKENYLSIISPKCFLASKGNNIEMKIKTKRKLFWLQNLILKCKRAHIKYIYIYNLLYIYIIYIYTYKSLNATEFASQSMVFQL